MGLKQLFGNPDEQVDLTVQSIYKGHHKVTYRGVNAIRCPFDYVIYQMIISEIKPDLIVEFGTSDGGGALYMADLLDMNGKGEVHTVDINKVTDVRVTGHPRIKLFSDGWQNYDSSLCKGHETVMIVEDASHMYKDTLGILNRFAPFVTKNSYLIVEDGIISELGFNKQFEGGPLRALREFLPANPQFAVDRKWCDMFGKNATFNVNGYLKRIS